MTVTMIATSAVRQTMTSISLVAQPIVLITEIALGMGLMKRTVTEMYEELIANLRNCAETNSLSLYKCELMKQAADAIEELQRQIDAWVEPERKALIKSLPKWIPVTERLPEDRRDVLVYAGVMFPYITVGYYDGLWKFSYNDEEITGSADYWMPLPEPPKEESK